VVEQQKKFAYTKKNIDQEIEIENEIQRELEVSRARRTNAEEEKKDRSVIYHHTRTIEQPRYVEEQNVGVYDRTATYDAINRSGGKYQHIDDSYYVEQRPERIERVVETISQPAIIQTSERRRGTSRGGGTFVNEKYRADGMASSNRRSGQGYVSVEPVRSTVREVVTHQSPHNKIRTGTFGNTGESHYESNIIREGGEVVNRGNTRYIEEEYLGDGMERNIRTGVGGTVITGGTLGGGNVRRIQSSSRYVRSPEGKAEMRSKLHEERMRSELPVQGSPRSYSSNQNLRVERTGGGGKVKTTKTKIRTTTGRRNFDDFDSEDDSD